MKFRLLIVLMALTACSGAAVTKTIDVSAARLAEIKSTPYIAGNNPGGFPTAGLSGLDEETWPEGIRFTGFGPYLYEMGFKKNMMITAIDGVGVHEIFVGRWQDLRLKDPAAFDASHYKDLIEYMFAKEPGAHVDVTVDVSVSAAAIKAGNYKPETEVWRINFQR